MKHLLPLIVAIAALGGCNSEPETIVAGQIDDPMEDELAAADPVDPANVPMGIGGDDYRCRGSNQLVRVDFIRTGEVMTARVTPQGERGMTLTQVSDGGAYTSEDGALTMNGTPNGESVTLNGATCVT